MQKQRRNRTIRMMYLSITNRKMVLKRNKISRGLGKLLKRKEVNHFENNSNIFLEDPLNRNRYMELFTQAQLAEIANSEYK